MAKQFILAVSVFYSLMACTAPANKEADFPMAEPAPAPVMHTGDCYSGIVAKDTINMNITPDGDAVSGELYYNFQRKMTTAEL